MFKINKLLNIFKEKCGFYLNILTINCAKESLPVVQLVEHCVEVTSLIPILINVYLKYGVSCVFQIANKNINVKYEI